MSSMSCTYTKVTTCINRLKNHKTFKYLQTYLVVTQRQAELNLRQSDLYQGTESIH